MHLRASCTVTSGGGRQWRCSSASWPHAHSRATDRPRRLLLDPCDHHSAIHSGTGIIQNTRLAQHNFQILSVVIIFWLLPDCTSDHVVSSRVLPRQPPPCSRSAADATAANTFSTPRSPSARHVARSGLTVPSVTRRRLTTRCCRALKWSLCVKNAKRPSEKMHASSRIGMHERNIHGGTLAKRGVAMSTARTAIIISFWMRSRQRLR